MDRSYEFDPTPPHWIVRLGTTSLTDALCGRFFGRYDARQEIAASGLPMPIAGVIQAIVKRTRLWRSEKLDIAKELINHFSDGLVTGRTPELLVVDFGSPERAARLIRKAKLRQRPAAWQAWWYVSRGVVAILALIAIAYGLLAARFLMTRPSINHNYWEEINARRVAPETERAWPLYREALLALTPDDTKLLHSLIDANDLTGSRTSELIDRCQRPLNLIREAARRPQMGYLVGDPADRAAAQAAGNEVVFHPGSHLAADNATLIQMSLDGMQALRELARLMTVDAIHAAAAGDGDRVAKDTQSLLAMSTKTFQPKSPLVEQLIGSAIFVSAVDIVGQILRDYPLALSDPQLRDLAHAFAAYRHGDLSFDLDGERLIFLDQLQRIYSDDGYGDGRVSPEGLRWIGALGGGVTNSVPEPQLRGLGPGIAAFIANRAEAERFYNELMAESLAAHEGPPWLWDAAAISAVEDRYRISGKAPTARLRHVLTYLLTPWIGGALDAAERNILQRDAITTAIALELWRRQHGAWPERLDQLVPSMLPTLPIDRYDGQPLRYTLLNGKPLLYSIGVDRNDDGGRPTNPPDSAAGSFEPHTPNKTLSATSNGDWILWPQLPSEKQPTDD